MTIYRRMKTMNLIKNKIVLNMIQKVQEKKSKQEKEMKLELIILHLIKELICFLNQMSS